MAEALRAETVGGVLMVAAAVLALVWANTPWLHAYESFQNLEFGPSWFHLTVAHAASEGLLAVFFFIAGLELREEFTHGELQELKTAVLPIFSAVAGVIMPAVIYLAVSAGEPGASEGWAIPTATDIAFALAILAITYSRCPPALRAFLLTLAVIDDLIAITIIAVFYSDELRLLPLAVGVTAIAVYALLQHRGFARLWLTVPLALLAWAAVYKSGIHATVAGVALGLLTSTAERPGTTADGPGRSAAERADHLLRPVSAGFCVPVFAFMNAGVPLSGQIFGELVRDRVALGVVAGLVIGKFVGVLGGAWTAVRLGFARLGDGLHWREIVPVAMLAGVGFTVSLLIGDLAYAGTPRNDRVTTAVLVASVIASGAATVAFRIRVRQRVRGEAEPGPR